MRVTPSTETMITVRLKPDTTGTTPGSPEARRYPRADFRYTTQPLVAFR